MPGRSAALGNRRIERYRIARSALLKRPKSSGKTRSTTGIRLKRATDLLDSVNPRSTNPILNLAEWNFL